MLAPDERAVLLEALRPPAGMVLDAAVATTFTLDLEGALVPPLAFAAAELSRADDTLATLQALRGCADRIDVFHQAGHIAAPARVSGLLAYLEPMLHAVRRPRPGYLFHPKVWFLRYVEPDTAETAFRLLCLTRNLTQDRSWDAVVRLDGTALRRPLAANRPIADLIRALPGLAVSPLPVDRLERLDALAEDARRVEWDHPADVAELYFHTLGVRGAGSLDFTGRRHLVVSPFLTEGGLEIVAPGAGDLTVVSRPESLDALSPDALAALSGFVFTAVPAPDENSTNDDDGPEPPGQARPFSLHAKIVVVERGHRAHVHLGSANATEAAFDGNIEFVVEMVGSRHRLGIDTFIGAGQPLRAFLEEYHGEGGVAPDPDDDARRALESLLRDLSEVPFVVTVGESTVGQSLLGRSTVGEALAPIADPSSYVLQVTSKAPVKLRDGVRGVLEMLTMPGEARPLPSSGDVEVQFRGVQLGDITPFLVLRLETADGIAVAGVVRAELVGDPPGRLDHLLARQIDTPEKFLRFLALLLGLDAGPVAGHPGTGSAGSWQGTERLAAGGGILEAALRALAENPRVIVDLDRLVSGLARSADGRAVMPDGFPDLWRIVMAAHERLTGTPPRPTGGPAA